MSKASSEKDGSKNPAYPGADPTSPGGMSQKALADELIERHGYTKEQVVKLWRVNRQWKRGSWPAMIDAVIQGRLDREREQQVETTVAEIAEVEEIIGAVEVAAESAEAAAVEAEIAEINAARAARAEQDAANSLLVKDPAGIGSLDYIFNGHMGAGPSGAERWMNCTASLGASRRFLETLTPNQQREFSQANEAARQGTTAHAAAEVEALVLLGRMDYAEAQAVLTELSIMPDAEVEAYDEEMGEYISEYVDLIRTFASERGNDRVLIEQVVEAAVPLTGLHEGEVYSIRGSGDCVVLPTDDERTLVVVDLKYGNGVDVSVDANPQVRIYGLGALDLLTDDEGNLIAPVDEVVYYIVQPRLGGIKRWSESLDDLLDWRDDVLAPASTAALFGVDEGATFTPSESACQFCPVRGSCEALTEARIEAGADLFDVIGEAEYANGPGSFPETSGLTDERLGDLLTQISALVDLHADLKAEAQRRLFRGAQIPGFKLVSYTPPRKWKEGAAEIITNAELFKPKALITPLQAIKLVGDEQIGHLIDVPDRRPVIGKTNDRRREWDGRPPEAMFDDEQGAE